MKRSPLLAALRAVSRAPDAVPPGYRTVNGWAKRWRLSNSQASKILRAGVAAGLVQVRTFRRHGPVGRIYPVPHYAEHR